MVSVSIWVVRCDIEIFHIVSFVWILFLESKLIFFDIPFSSTICNVVDLFFCGHLVF